LKSAVGLVAQPAAESLKSSVKMTAPRSAVSTVEAVTGVGDVMAPLKPPLQEIARLARHSAPANRFTFTV
jgi:hypothetical protein